VKGIINPRKAYNPFNLVIGIAISKATTISSVGTAQLIKYAIHVISGKMGELFRLLKKLSPSRSLVTPAKAKTIINKKLMTSTLISLFLLHLLITFIFN